MSILSANLVASFTGVVPLLFSYAQACLPFLNNIVETLNGWITVYGLPGLFAAMILASVVSPIPNEAILVFAGIVMNPIDVAIVGALGSTVGGVVSYSIARYGGRPLVEKFVNKKTIASAGRWFAKKKRLAILLCRFIPFIPFDAVSYFAGLAKMKIYPFTLLTLIGSVPRCLFYAYIGELILEYNTQALIITFAALIIVFIFYRIKRSKISNSESSLKEKSAR